MRLAESLLVLAFCLLFFVLWMVDDVIEVVFVLEPSLERELAGGFFAPGLACNDLRLALVLAVEIELALPPSPLLSASGSTIKTQYKKGKCSQTEKTHHRPDKEGLTRPRMLRSTLQCILGTYETHCCNPCQESSILKPRDMHTAQILKCI